MNKEKEEEKGAASSAEHREDADKVTGSFRRGKQRKQRNREGKQEQRRERGAGYSKEGYEEKEKENSFASLGSKC